MWPWQAIFSLCVICSIATLQACTMPAYWKLRHTQYMTIRNPKLGILFTCFSLFVCTTICSQCILISLTHAGYSDTPTFPNWLMLVASVLHVGLLSVALSCRAWELYMKYDPSIRNTELVKWIDWRYQIRVICMWVLAGGCVVAVLVPTMHKYHHSDNNEGYATRYFDDWYIYVVFSFLAMRSGKFVNAAIRTMDDSMDVSLELRQTLAGIMIPTYLTYILNLITAAFVWSGSTAFDRNGIELAGLPLDYAIVLMHVITYRNTILLPMARCKVWMQNNRRGSYSTSSSDTVTASVNTDDDYWNFFVVERKRGQLPGTTRHTRQSSYSCHSVNDQGMPIQTEQSRTVATTQKADELSQLHVSQLRPFHRPAVNKAPRTAVHGIDESCSKSTATKRQTTLPSKPQHHTCLTALCDPALFKLFDQHAKRSLNGELMTFWSEMDGYRDKFAGRKSASVVEQNANNVTIDIDDEYAHLPVEPQAFCQYVAAKYVQLNSPFELNISDQLRHRFLKLAAYSSTDIQQHYTATSSIVTSHKHAHTDSTVSQISLPGLVEDSGAADSTLTITLNITATAVQQYENDLFDCLIDIQREIYKLISTNVWLSFKRSAEYTQLVQPT